MILWCYSGRFGVLFWTREDGRLLREVCTILEHVDFSEKCVRFLKMSIFPKVCTILENVTRALELIWRIFVDHLPGEEISYSGPRDTPRPLETHPKTFGGV